MNKQFLALGGALLLTAACTRNSKPVVVPQDLFSTCAANVVGEYPPSTWTSSSPDSVESFVNKGDGNYGSTVYNLKDGVFLRMESSTNPTANNSLAQIVFTERSSENPTIVKGLQGCKSLYEPRFTRPSL